MTPRGEPPGPRFLPRVDQPLPLGQTSPIGSQAGSFGSQALEETSPRQAPAAPAAANGDPVDIGLFLANSSIALSPNGPLATFHTSAERPWLFLQTKSNAPMVLDCAGVAVLRTLFEFTDVPWEVALRDQVKRRRRECPFADA